MRNLLFLTVFLSLSLQSLDAEPLGKKVNRFQLVAHALKHPGLYRAAIDYMELVSFPKNEVLTCYWNVSLDTGDIFITNVLPGTTRTIHFTKSGEKGWKAEEI